jgi:hypothetical protein
VVNDLACLSKTHVAQAREQIRELVGARSDSSRWRIAT